MDSKLTEKKEALFQAVDSLMDEGVDLGSMTVAQIAGRAGIGKGTTYEYFATKEELIGSAMLYRISTICREIHNGITAQPSVRDSVEYLLDAIEHKGYEKAVLLKVVNIVTDNSPISREIEKLLTEHLSDTYMPEHILDGLFSRAKEEGLMTRGLPDSYLKLSVGAKLLSYVMFTLMPTKNWDCDAETMHRTVREGILSELA